LQVNDSSPAQLHDRDKSRVLLLVIGVILLGNGITGLLLRVYAMRMAAVFTISTATITLRAKVSRDGPGFSASPSPPSCWSAWA
jgi:hypothetical protein